MSSFGRRPSASAARICTSIPAIPAPCPAPAPFSRGSRGTSSPPSSSSWARVLATDPVPARRDLALKVGAEHVAWGGDGELLDAVLDWTAGQGAPAVIDTTGDPGALAQATRMVCSVGTVVVVWMSAAAAPLRSGVFPEKEIDVLGSSCATAPDYRSAVALVQAHRETIAALFSHRFPLTRAREAIDCVANPAAG